MATDVSLIRRVGMAKTVGIAVGLVGFFMVPNLWPEEGLWLRWGLLLWYILFGAVIGMFGMIDVHPVFNFRMPFWFRGILFGAWLNFVLALLMHDKLTELFATLPPPLDGFHSPFWIVAEGAIVGLLIDWIATRFGGEGREVLAA